MSGSIFGWAQLCHEFSDITERLAGGTVPVDIQEPSMDPAQT
eukprot:CAMPEP_0170193822 /NCGR_PEP_ID=MMETSP0040_2-20121228/57809_1 /TAXON_ID=641309 /ORGANISM="Lotharella oceanica, Strain CCMP622" /LENGTH=41 /DNA_ID= /DNA_START= /DNA_END= /DNA_ORIENTATION=